MANYTQFKGQEGQEPWYDLWTGHITATESVANEVEAARLGETSLAVALNKKASTTFVQEYVQSQVLTGGIDLQEVGTAGQVLMIGNDYSLQGSDDVSTLQSDVSTLQSDVAFLNQNFLAYSLLFGS